MLRSHSQVLYSYLPGSVFRHEDRVYGKVLSVGGSRLNSLNEAVIFEEIANYLEQWPEEMRHDLPLPKAERIKEYRIMKPDSVRWELFPLIFECSRRSCSRVHSLTRGPRQGAPLPGLPGVPAAAAVLQRPQLRSDQADLRPQVR
jgi:hypothetical protein